MTVTISPLNIAFGMLISAAVAVFCWTSAAPARTIEMQKAMAIVVKEKPAPNAPQDGSAGSSSSQSGDTDSQDNDEDDDASPDDDQTYST